jgi:CDGSH-type Zn-finger protein
MRMARIEPTIVEPTTLVCTPLAHGGPAAMPDATDATGVTITVRDNAFYRVAGPFTLLDGEGNAFELEAGRAVTLCRCGGSATKPICDSSHRSNGFSSAVRAARGEDPASS